MTIVERALELVRTSRGSVSVPAAPLKLSSRLLAIACARGVFASTAFRLRKIPLAWPGRKAFPF